MDLRDPFSCILHVVCETPEHFGNTSVFVLFCILFFVFFCFLSYTCSDSMSIVQVAFVNPLINETNYVCSIHLVE